MKKVLLTGGNGFIAKRILVDLLEAGYSVNVTLRDINVSNIMKQNLSLHTKKLDQIQFFECDLELDDGWEEAIEGCDFIMHVACPTPMSCGNDIESYLMGSKDGTLRLLKLVVEKNISKIVITSSITALIYNDNRKSPFTFNEESRSDLSSNSIGLYGQSKTITDAAVWTFAKENNIQSKISCIYPGLVLGPCLDTRLNLSTLYLNQLTNGSFPMVPEFSWPIVDVRDVSKIHIMAMTEPQLANQRLILGNESLSLMEISDIIKTKYPEFENKLPRAILPEFIAKLLAYIDPKLKNISGDIGVEVVANNKVTNGILNGFKFRTAEESILDTVESLIELKLAA